MAQHRYTLLKLVVAQLPALFGYDLHTAPLPRRLRRKSIAIRHLDGGSSNAAEMELTALTNPMYDLGQHGIQFVSSPRHADILLLTGPLTWNMLGPAQAVFDAMPEPKRIVTVGDCANFGHENDAQGCLFDNSYATTDLPANMRAAIVAHIPGNPPSPDAIIEKLLSLETM